MAKTVGIGDRLATLDEPNVLLEVFDQLLDMIAAVAVELGADPLGAQRLLEEPFE